MKPLLIVLLCLFTFNKSQSQEFWHTTYSFPGGIKTSVTLASDTCLIVGLPNHIFRSTNNGFSWDSTLKTKGVFCLFTAKSGTVLAGGTGTVFYSNNLGYTWDSVSFGNTYPVTKIIQNADGNLFAITGELDIEKGYVGAGVYYSNDNGKSWSQRNNGLGVYLCCEQIASDKNGRLYLGVPDEYVTGNGGLFISDNNGLLWEHIDIDIDGKNTVSDRIKIANVKGLSVSPQDSLYFSFSGVAVNVLVTLNTIKSINDIRNNSYWRVRKISNSVNWWNDKQLNPIHFAKNGDWYSSANGSYQVGGTFLSTDRGLTWNPKRDGLGFDITGYYNVQFFTENSAGRITMVQFLDERVYWTDASVPTSVDEEYLNVNENSVFPNLIASNSHVHIQFSDNSTEKHVTISNSLGEVIYKQRVSDSFTMNSPVEKGMWFVQVHDKGAVKTFKLLVH